MRYYCADYSANVVVSAGHVLKSGKDIDSAWAGRRSRFAGTKKVIKNYLGLLLFTYF